MNVLLKNSLLLFILSIFNTSAPSLTYSQTVPQSIRALTIFSVSAHFSATEHVVFTGNSFEPLAVLSSNREIAPRQKLFLERNPQIKQKVIFDRMEITIYQERNLFLHDFTQDLSRKHDDWIHKIGQAKFVKETLSALNDLSLNLQNAKAKQLGPRSARRLAINKGFIFPRHGYGTYNATKSFTPAIRIGKYTLDTFPEYSSSLSKHQELTNNLLERAGYYAVKSSELKRETSIQLPVFPILYPSANNLVSHQSDRITFDADSNVMARYIN